MNRTVRVPGLNKSSVKRNNKRPLGGQQVLAAGKQDEREEQQRKRRRNKVQSFSVEDQDDVRQMDADTQDTTFVNLDESLPSPLPDAPSPGQEGQELSYEGGEFEVFKDLVDDVERLSGLKRYDDRTRGDRTERLVEGWALQMESLVAAYLKYRATDDGDGFPPAQAPCIPSESQADYFSIDCIDVFARKKIPFITNPGEKYINQSLIVHGYIGCSPLQPALAISLRTLELYRQAHRSAPHFSIESQCKTLCYMHGIAYDTYLRTQFTTAFDAYLEITRQVDVLVNDALGFTDALSRIRYSCPCCFYKLQDEPELEFSCMVSIDGNNSLKRLGSSFRNHEDRVDTRTMASDRWITAAEVNKFHRDKAPSQIPNKSPEDVDIGLDDQSWEDIDESQPGTLKCIDRWKNAGPDERKKMFALFDESGIFVASCRHRMVLAACDMIQSGESSKYPLAVLNRLIDIVGPNMGCAYDIGCAFNTTLHSSALRSKAMENHVRLMVGSFHGHAHNRSCQLRWHPLHIPGAGMSEGEGCEHVFSASNELARTTRHASRFHRHQAIEEHFRFWDDDKYANLSTFLKNHYREASTLIRTLEAELDILKLQLGLTNKDFEDFLVKECTYLEGLKGPSATVTSKIRYVEAINELAKRRAEWNAVRNDALSLTPLPGVNFVQHATNSRLRVDAAYSRLQHAEELVDSLEQSLGIQERWTSTSPEYIEYYQQTVATDYTTALNELERLVVMRLFELAKIQSSGTGYKLRRYIGKALQRRSEAIRNAINRYNTQAARLDPPRPPLTWKEVVDYSFLGEFDLLRLGQHDIRSELWADPSRREGTVKYFKLCRAKEELIRVNIEIRRLCTFIRDETRHMSTIIANLSLTNPNLASELKRRWVLRHSNNSRHLLQLREMVQSGPLYGDAADVTVFPAGDDWPLAQMQDLSASSFNVSMDTDRCPLPDEEETTRIEEAEADLVTMTEFTLRIRD